MGSIKSYNELIRIPCYMERINYLKLNGHIGDDTFGFDRYLNQAFYKSREWKEIRDRVIVRDNGCDLGFLDRPIPTGVHILIHHINPITKDDIMLHDDKLLDMNNLISVTQKTHNLIHYGFLDISNMIDKEIIRSPDDTKLW